MALTQYYFRHYLLINTPPGLRKSIHKFSSPYDVYVCNNVSNVSSNATDSDLDDAYARYESATWCIEGQQALIIELLQPLQGHER